MMIKKGFVLNTIHQLKSSSFIQIRLQDWNLNKKRLGNFTDTSDRKKQRSFDSKF